MILGSGKKQKRKIKETAKLSLSTWGALSTGLLGIGSVLKGDVAGALLYASLLAPSVYGVVKGVKRVKKLKGGDMMMGYGDKRHVKISHIKKAMKAHPSDRAIHVSDLKLSPKKIKTIRAILEKGHPHEGSGLKKKLKKGFHASKTKLKKFFAGETKYKPSQLLEHIGMATGVASVFMPPLAIPTVAAKLGSQYLKSRGQGLTPTGGSGLKPAGGALQPTGSRKPYTKPYRQKCPKMVKKGGARPLEGHLPEHHEGAGLHPTGGAIGRTGGVYMGHKGGDRKHKKRGTRGDVWDGYADMTSGGLKKSDLVFTGQKRKNKKTGMMERVIKSKKKMMVGKKLYMNNKDKLKGGRYH